jgi:uncharacterized protein YjiS (DUF1127 family)
MLNPAKLVSITGKRPSVQGYEPGVQSRSRRDLAQTLDRSAADASLLPEAMAPMTVASATWPRLVWFLIEGFALYGASLHGIATLPVTVSDGEASAPQPRDSYWRERRKSISLVSSSASTGMTQREYGPVDQIGVVSRTYSSTGGYGTLAVNRSSRRGWLIRIWRAIARRRTKWCREREIKQVVAALEEFDDRTLRDVGIRGRGEIEQAVRRGRYWLG